MGETTRCVLVPGAAGRASFWDPLRAELATIAVTDTTALDWPGVGGSTPDPAVASHRDLARLAAASFDRPGLLCAQSAGCLAGLLVALEHPELVSHLVLVAAAAGVDTEALGGMNWRADLRMESPATQSWVFECDEDLTPRLGELRMPTLLVWATRDPISPLAVGEHLQRHIGGARLVTFDTDDHWVARLEAPTVARHIAELLAG